MNLQKKLIHKWLAVLQNIFPSGFKIAPLFCLTFFILLIFTGCFSHSHAYRKSYAYLKEAPPKTPYINETDYYIVFLVNARHLDYTDCREFLQSCAKHPSDGTKNGDVGHCWILLHGIKNGKEIIIEGGHSGELGEVQPRYWEGVINYAEFGYLNPTPEQQLCPRFEPNPIKYLWAIQNDGFFQKGSGHHEPTFAAKVDLTEEQFDLIRHYISPTNYPYKEYSLTGNQCATFLTKIATFIDLEWECQVTVDIQSKLNIAGYTLLLWTDDCYSEITFASPDRIEECLMKAVNEGKAENALEWYLKKNPKPVKKKLNDACDTLRHFPSRIGRVLLLQ